MPSITDAKMGEFKITKTEPRGNAGWFTAGTIKWHFTYATGRTITIETEFENAPNRTEAVKAAALNLEAFGAAILDVAQRHTG